MSIHLYVLCVINKYNNYTLFYVKDDRYDYDYQQARELSNEVTVYPGDELITECVYNTVDRPHLTHVRIILLNVIC
jgi:hypothetical protein